MLYGRDIMILHARQVVGKAEVAGKTAVTKVDYDLFFCGFYFDVEINDLVWSRCCFPRNT